MPLSITELYRARETAAGLLDDLGLEAYLFEVEPGTTEWEIRVECATEEGWEMLRFGVPFVDLVRSGDSDHQRHRLLDDWRHRTAGCKLRRL